jgi:Bacterial Ig-like domain
MQLSGSQISLLLTLTVTAVLTACGGGSSGGGNDITPPAVVATDPPNGAVGVQLDDPIVVTFSETINPSSVTGNFQITDDMSNPVSGTVSASGRTARFTPANNALVKSALYHAMLTTGIKDPAGNALAANFDWTFTTTTDAWTSTAVNASTPTARLNHTAVWTGSEMIVWGGNDGLGVVNSGGRFDPNTDGWTGTTTVGAPLQRTDHTAVWTGTEMIVWGGSGLGGSNLTNTGGRYSPVTDNWTSTPTATAPTPRIEHTAVWTGGEMIVWGGTTDTGRTNTGGRFNPSAAAGAGTWTATSLSGAPTPRFGHTAVWTGNEMIVWGGNDGILTFSGGRFRPSTNSWFSVSTNGAPSARAGHTAVWTGTEMIVWGGDAGFGPLFDGARYNPATNTWKPIATAPIARSDHEAIWTGTEMIVWGGDTSDNSGAAYNPAHDTWRSISITGAPTGRTDHTAVWTGKEMIVWGGTDSTGPTASGGRYTP